MSEPARTWQALRARGPVYIVYLVVCFLGLLVVMYIAADRISQPSRTVVVDSELVTDSEPRSAPVDNEFVPVERDISDCISAIPKPGCGSDARGGWRQGLVLMAILAGLALIVWRIVTAARGARRDQMSST